MDEKRPAGRLCLDDYKDALRGEICNLIGHNPDDDELATMEAYAADYVADQINSGKVPDLSGIVYALLECKKEQFIQCVECGDYFLPAEINDITCEHCLTCKPYPDPDGMPGGWDDLKTRRDE